MTNNVGFDARSNSGNGTELTSTTTTTTTTESLQEESRNSDANTTEKPMPVEPMSTKPIPKEPMTTTEKNSIKGMLQYISLITVALNY